MSLPVRNEDGTINRNQDVITRLQHTYRVLSPGLDAKYFFEPTPLRPRQFPALTPAERLHLETRGYVVIKNVLTVEECEALKKDLYMIEAAYRETGDLPAGMDPNTFTFFTGTSDEFFRVDNLPHLAKSFYDYVTHPRLLAIMEEICGAEVRLEQSDAAIRRPSNPGGDTRQPGQGYGLHGGLKGYTGKAYQHEDKGLYHYTFVKTLTNLSDLGPGDGGTVVIPGRCARMLFQVDITHYVCKFVCVMFKVVSTSMHRCVVDVLLPAADADDVQLPFSKYMIVCVCAATRSLRTPTRARSSQRQ
jgi:hypothetical protein